MEINQKKIETLFKVGYNKLNDFQKEIFNECTKRNSGGLSLPMGSGKTLIAIILALHNVKETGLPILILCSKSLIASWELEIRKFFGEELKYEFVHKGNLKDKMENWTIREDIQLILTTPDNMRIFYTENDVRNEFIKEELMQLNHRWHLQQRVLTYISPEKPFLNDLKGGGVFYSQEWGTIIVDEAQRYTNINTKNCQALCSLYSKKRWVLSGTMFDEPKSNKALGYFKLIDDKIGRQYNSVPRLHDYIRSDEFKGFNRTLVQRDSNPAFIPPKVNKYNITHDLKPEEGRIYKCMKNILVEIKKKADALKRDEQYRDNRNIEQLRKFNAMKLSLIIYMRQVLVCSIIPITSIAIDMFDYQKNTELSEIVMKEINKIDITDFLNDENNVKSSRIEKILETIDKHEEEKIVLFSGFKTPVDILQHYIPEDRPTFRMNSKMSSAKRGELIEDFKNSGNGVLLLTYQMGAEGLNLQFASTVILTDFWWNCCKTKQAIARVFRYGQISDEINIYTFIANTGIEKIMLEKQRAKRVILNELRTGPMRTEIPKIKKVDDLIELIAVEDNEKIFDDVYNKTINDLVKDYKSKPKPKPKRRSRYARYARRYARRYGIENNPIYINAEEMALMDRRYGWHNNWRTHVIRRERDKEVCARMVSMRGLNVSNVIPGSPAHNQILPYDYIVGINGYVVEQMWICFSNHPDYFRNNQLIRFYNGIILQNVGKPVVFRVFNLQGGEFRDVTIVQDENLDGWHRNYHGTTIFERYLGLQCNIDNMKVFLPGSDLPYCVSAVLETF